MKEFCPAQFYFKKRFKGLFIVESALSLSSWFTGTPLKYWLTNKCFKHNVTGLKNLNWQEGTRWLFTSVAEDLNSGRQRTNPARG